MVVDLDKIPTEISELQKVIAVLSKANKDLIDNNQELCSDNRALIDTNNFLNDKNQSLLSEISILKEQLALLNAKRFGKSSEKTEQQIKEIELKIEEKEIILDLKFQIDRSKKECEQEEKLKPKRKKLPENLPRDKVLLSAPSICPTCGKEDFRKIDDDVSEALEYIPSSFKVIRYVRPRCVCKACETIVQAYPPSKGIDKGKAGFGLLAHVMVQKYCNHLPLYRQSAIYAREGIDLSRSTMAGWVGQCARLLDPLVDEIKKGIFSGTQIHGDDTPVRVLGNKIGTTKTGILWTYVLDGRPHGDLSPPAACYFYSPDRKGIRPAEHLKHFKGVLHADAYPGYNNLYDNPNSSIYEAGCWAHTRRKFYEVTIANDNAVIAQHIVEQIGRIYAVESEVRGLDASSRQAVRATRSTILVEDLFTSFRNVHGKLPRKSATARDIDYALNNEKALKRFLTDGKIEIDNNAAERALRSVAVGRKNWMFAGSDAGGNTAANIYTIIETAKLNGINPWLYLYKVLSVIQDYNSQKIYELLPWNIKLE